MFSDIEPGKDANRVPKTEQQSRRVRQSFKALEAGDLDPILIGRPSLPAVGDVPDVDAKIVMFVFAEDSDGKRMASGEVENLPTSVARCIAQLVKQLLLLRDALIRVLCSGLIQDFSFSARQKWPTVGRQT